MGTRQPLHVLTDADDLADVRDSTDLRLLLLHPASVAAQPAEDQIALPVTPEGGVPGAGYLAPKADAVLVQRRSTPTRGRRSIIPPRYAPSLTRLPAKCLRSDRCEDAA